MKLRGIFLFGLAMVLGCRHSLAAVAVIMDRNSPGMVTGDFRFKTVPAPAGNDAGAKAVFSVVAGAAASDKGLAALNDGRLPEGEDEPVRNFYFAHGTQTGRLLADLGQVIEVHEVNTYSWHSGSRAPQVYALYGSDGTAAGFNPGPATGTSPESSGWRLIARVDTRPKGEGGQHGVSIRDPAGSLGRLRYLLFETVPTEKDDPFGNTFFSEIDILDRDGPASEAIPTRERTVKIFEVQGGIRFAIDTSNVPDLREWAESELGPAVKTWYPKIVSLLPGEGFEAPKEFTIQFRHGNKSFVAVTYGNRIDCSIDWFRDNRETAAKGCVVHELVHVVQHYGQARAKNTKPAPVPGWVTEGIPDYIRWYLYEPQTKGAEINKANIANAKYDGSYRPSANFLHWVTEKYDRDLVRKLNAAARDGVYDAKLWLQWTGKTEAALGAEWKADHQRRLGTASGKEP